MTRRETLWLVILTLAGGALRFSRLDAQSLWIDEYLMVLRASLGEPFRWADWFVNPQGPLPALVIRLWSDLCGTSDWILRIPSACYGTATIPGVFFLARRMCRSAAWPATVLATLSPFLLWYSQEARHYGLAFLVATWSGIAFLRLAEDPPGRKGRILYPATLLIGMLSHLVMGFVALAHGLTLLFWRRERMRAWLTAAIPAFLLFTPWLWYSVTQNLNLEHVARIDPIPVSEMLRGQTTFSWLALPFTGLVLLGGYSLGPPVAELHAAPHLSTVLPDLPLIAPLGLGALILAVAGLVRLRREPGRLTLVAFWVLLPLVAVMAMSWRNLKPFNPRYLGMALPVILVVLGAGFSLLARSRRWLAALVALMVVVPMTVALGNYFTDPRYAHEDVRGAARILRQEATGEDIILGQGAARVLDWYYKGPAGWQLVYGVWTRDSAVMTRKLDEWTNGRRYAWLLISRPWLDDPELTLRALMERRFGPGHSYPLAGVQFIRFTVQPPAGGAGE